MSRIAMVGVLLLVLVLQGREAAAAPPVPPDLLTGDGVARGVLFYSPTCPHCHVVIDDVLPPLRRTFGGSLLLAEVDATTPAGRAVWQAAVQTYEPSVVGFPTLIIGEYVLIGSREIPQALPGIIQGYLDEGGVGWPAIEGLDAVVIGLEPSGSAGIVSQMRSRFQRDVVGNTLSVVLLIGLLAGLIAVSRPRDWQMAWSKQAGLWLLLPLVVGLGISLYLTRVEVSGAKAVCGPVGDCNAVQESSYALLFGFLPVALLGAIGYSAILFTYGAWILTDTAIRCHLPGVIFAVAVLGLAFATYLTFLEPFIIGATCAWCLAQAVCMLAVALLTAGPGWASLRGLGQELGPKRAPAR